MDNQDLTTDSSTSKVVVDKTNKYNSCESILNNNPNANTGIYSIVNNGNRYDVYCDMEYDGGGWTLVMKSNGNQSEFKYNSELWTDTSVTLNTESLNFDTSIPAKYESYNSVHGTEIRAEFPDKGHQMTESFRSSKTPYDIFTTTNELGFENDGYGIPPCSTSAGIGRYGDYWTNANGESNLNNSETIFAHQCGYQKYGFNISTSDSGFTANNVRWGWQWNNENDSFQSQDTTSGIGMDEYTYDGYTYKTTTGSQVYCCSNKDSLRDENDGEHPRDILIWIR